jgi:hypothetical protein
MTINPGKIWGKLSFILGLNKTHPNIIQFKSVRYNTQYIKGMYYK